MTTLDHERAMRVAPLLGQVRRMRDEARDAALALAPLIPFLRDHETARRQMAALREMHAAAQHAVEWLEEEQR